MTGVHGPLVVREVWIVGPVMSEFVGFMNRVNSRIKVGRIAELNGWEVWDREINETHDTFWLREAS
jgi:hypothetical protein